MQIQKKVPIETITTFQNKGTISELWTLESVSDAQELIKSGKAWTVLGKGSNTLLRGRSVDIVAQVSPKSEMPIVSGTKLTVSAGTSGNRLLKLCQENGLTGVEFCAGVPTTVGGMVTMNFGCWGDEIGNHVESVGIVNSDGEYLEIASEDMAFSYRESRIQKEKWIVMTATFFLEEDDPATIQSRITQMIQTRLEKQPLRENSFGSIFKNPRGKYAGQIIEQLGLKGLRQGDIHISQKHANFMVNDKNGTYEEAITLIQHIQDEVQKKSQVQLEPEVQIVP
ncbi:UDP-N-acetylmuramate dehydrogenase [bacterium]|jgi:UDP-N-acetylmuramate dehydrogenase|nr:UDP-N-acetylmuramate dehydrogenase [bacterium]